MNEATAAIRKRIVSERRSLDDDWQAAASWLITEKVIRLRPMQRARRVGVYLGVRGEVSCDGIIERAILRKKRVFLPVLRDAGLKFARLEPGAKMRPNRFGILEPVYDSADLLSGFQLDIVIAPLVAFDSQCNRIGMGGGFYDRSFAFRKRRTRWTKPLLIGVAYDFQRVNAIEAEPWDVPLDAVITETSAYGFDR